jgi:hypothetical protein
MTVQAFSPKRSGQGKGRREERKVVQPKEGFPPGKRGSTTLGEVQTALPIRYM